jgi:quercetin dioxygenase-like cupin family protein
VGTRDGSVVAAGPGETVTCDPGVPPWRGATTSTLAVHIALVVASETHDGTDWCEPVDDEQYEAANHTTGPQWS